MTTTNAMSTFKQALLDSVLCEYRSVPCENDISPGFSDDFYRAVRSMGKAAGGSVVHISWAWFRRVLVAAVICCLIASSAVATPYKPPEQVGLIIGKDGNRYSYSTVWQERGSMPDDLSFQAPCYLPEGFELCLDNSIIDRILLYLEYTRSDGELIMYRQNILAEYHDEYSTPHTNCGMYGTGIYSDHAEIYNDVINDLRVYFIYDPDCKDTLAVWTTDVYVFSIYFSPGISKQDMEHVIRSVVPNSSLKYLE